MNTRFVVRRLLQGIVVVWGIVTVVFLLRFIIPGDAINVIAPLEASPEVREQIARELGLHKPLLTQYFEYLIDVGRLDFGYSYISRTEVSPLVAARLAATAELALVATLISITISIPLGIISARRRHEPADYTATAFSLAGISMPNFWLGIMLILVLAVQFDLFPSSTRPVGLWVALEQLMFSFEVGPLGTWAWYIALPAVTLGTYFTAFVTRLTRSGMLEELGEGYIRAARAKGLPETLVLYKHALRNTLAPIINVLGLQVGTLLGGSVVTEKVFAWPGMGTLLIDGIVARNWPIIQATLIVIGCIYVVANILVDILYYHVNPRVIEQ